MRDAGLSLLRAVEVALDPAFSRTAVSTSCDNSNSVLSNVRKAAGGASVRRSRPYPRSTSTVSSDDYGAAALSDASRSR